jgi:crotonobetainyl-CoA:carnitine CoA-transferase CaiB-like acyl-CoA transferase
VPALADDERYATAGARSVNRDSLKVELEARMGTHDGKALADALAAAGVPCAPVLSVPDALQHPHTAHREMVVEMPGGYKGLGAPVKLSRTPATYRYAPLAEGNQFLPREAANEG